MKIGLLSDTHSYLDPKVFDYFKDCHEIWHAGDIGDHAVLDQLSAFKPVRAVFGNIDDKVIQTSYPEDMRLTIEGVKIWMTHIGGVPPNYNPRVKKFLQQQAPDLFICGHSHILRIKRDAKFNNMLYVNPGAAGQHGFHLVKTIVRFEIAAGKIMNMEVIELGKRGVIAE
ncbi:metallophosphoesterase family protein [Chryseolinea lacunae]|uniref:Phosphoesterase n=1 Tax=Chryseolinea lacunae TaxID=2801331 RepID=A0ABS1KPF0_9BACT|nr:metallophosphoesterase family protein [Chryseolinea lacunae]MBL0741244.1 metallophosphoesterase family protein [Chryseolinea lacunae]